MQISVIPFVIFMTFHKTVGRHSGAPCEAVDDMTPKLFAHGAPSNDSIPYEIMILTTTEQLSDCYRENREYLIRIKPMNAAENFAGFLLQSRDLNENRVGKFVNNSGDVGFWRYQCQDIENSVTHKSSSRKNKLDINWSTSNDVGPVIFYATVVKDQYVWWGKVFSKPFKSCRSVFAASYDPRSGTELSKNLQCDDKLPSCNSWSHLCSVHSFVFSYCRETCNRCSVD